MSLSSLQLDAFQAVARERSFSGAAKKLALTQSALSQRILNLEDELGTTLFIRDPAGIRITALGEKLLRYCQSKELLEIEFLSGLKSSRTQGLKGIVRIAGFSTIVQTPLVPALSQLSLANPGLDIETQSREVRELPALLSNGSVDFILNTSPFEKQGVENHLLGYELNVLVKPSLKAFRDNVFLDHDVDDQTTLEFFRLQGKKPLQKSERIRRNYFDDIHTILAAVQSGLGLAVVPQHLLCGVSGVEVVEGYKALKVPIYLSYFSQAFYTDLQKKLIELLSRDFPKHLQALHRELGA